MQRDKALVISDEELIAKVKAYLADKKYVTRGELRHKLNTSVARLEKLSKAGHFKFPDPISKSAAATIGRKKNNVMKGWYISRPTVFKESRPSS